MQWIKQTLILSSTFFFATGLSACAKDAELTVEEQEPVLSGRIIDGSNHPLKGAQVNLTIPDSTFRSAQMTKADGDFSLPHEPAKLCHLEVLPPKNSGLASAYLDHIPGEATRHVVIQLKAGVAIKGKLLGGDKGLKGLSVVIEPVAEKEKSIHANAQAKTGNNGEFEVSVTPGKKRFRVTNNRFDEYVATYQTEVDVTESGTIADISLPKITQAKSKAH